MARLGDGLPASIRARVWSTLADRQLAKQHVDWDHVIKVAFNEPSNQDDDRLGEQIVKDLHRTGCEQFGSDSDRASLKRVLLAYARWNKRVGYCQGFNVIAAAVLDVTARDEKKAFKIMVYLIDYVLPESYFAQNLQALSVDIAVFRQLLQTRLPELANHLDHLQYKAALETEYQSGAKRSPFDKQDIVSGKNQGAYEPPLMNVYIIQWFLTLFATCLAPDAVLRVWDSILLEGSEVILRTAIVIMDFLKSRLLKLKSADQFYSTMSDLLSALAEGKIVSSQELLFEIYELAPFPYPGLKELREKFMYNIAPLVLTNMNNNPFIDCTKNGQDNNKKQKKADKFNLLKYFSTSFKKPESLEPTSTVKNLTKFKKDNRCSNETTATRTAVKCENAQSPFREKLKVNQRENDENQSPPEVNTVESTNDTYEEISLAPNIHHSQSPKQSSGKFFSSSKTQNIHPNSNTGRNETNDKLRKLVNPPIKGAVRCFSAFWPEKNNDDFESLFSSKSCITESISMKSLHASHDDDCNHNHHTSNDVDNHHQSRSLKLFRFRSLRSSPVDNCETRVCSDISDIGPGAVSDAPRLTPMDKTSSADQARMTRDLEKLKSVYKRQQAACQRSTVIILPNDILQSTCCPTNMITVLPQKRQTNQKSLRNRQSVKSESFTSNNTLEYQTGEVKSFECDNDSCVSSNFLNKKIENSSNECICSDQRLIGAVRTWQKRAIWSSVSVDESDNTNLKVQTKEVNGEDLSPKHSNGRKPKLWELASSKEMKFCWPPKYSYSAETLNSNNPVCGDFPKSNDETNSNVSPKRDIYFPYNTSITYSKKFVSEYILMNMIKQHIEQKAADSLLDSELSKAISTKSSADVSNEDVNSNSEETASIYTSVSRSTARKLPWEEAAASFVSKHRSNHLNNTILSKRTTESFPVKMPLTQSRKEFGAKFGIYQGINSENSSFGSGFTDRVQVMQSVCANRITR
ncbi:unnamed protein product [Trichobilharzia szidati]|nr:unnamed protein product [Trichobilharzia szidati]